MLVERLRVASGFVESIASLGLHKAACGVPELHNRTQPGKDGWLAEAARNERSGRRPE